MGGGELKKRWLEVKIGTEFADFVIAKRIQLLTFFTVLLIPVIIIAFSAKASTASEEFLPADHPFQRVFTTLDQEFGTTKEDGPNQVTIAWGYDAAKGLVDRSGVNLLSTADVYGKPFFDETFKFDSATQTDVMRVCDDAHDQAFIPVDPETAPLRGVECFMYDFKDMLARKGETFPAAQGEVALFDWLNSTIPLTMKGAGKKRDGSFKKFKDKWSEDVIGFIDGDTAQYANGDPVTEWTGRKLKFVSIKVMTTLRGRGTQTQTQLVAEYDKFQGWVDAVNDAAPDSAGEVFQSCDGGFNGPKWVWMNTQSIFVSGAIKGACLGAALAFIVILIATSNIIVAVCSILVITEILTTVIALMVLVGWELGTIESTCITILCGFAVDYVVHYAHAYMHSPSCKRVDRVRDTLRTMGISVFSGMATSFLASLALFQCNLQFFAKFGTFLLFTVTSSWLWSNLLFMPLLAQFGPERNPVTGVETGAIPFPWASKVAHSGEEPTHATPVAVDQIHPV